MSEALARGDLSMDIEVRSDKDVVRRIFRDCVGQLRSIIGQLQDTVGVVASSTESIGSAVSCADEAIAAVRHRACFSVNPPSAQPKRCDKLRKQ